MIKGQKKNQNLHKYNSSFEKKCYKNWKIEHFLNLHGILDVTQSEKRHFFTNFTSNQEKL